MKVNNKRRAFLISSALGLGAVFISTGYYKSLRKTSDEDSYSEEGSFEYGVASGDPLVDSLILWTRVTPLGNDETVKLTYDVSLDEEFSRLIRSNEAAFAKKEHDFTVKIDLKNLSAGTTFF